MAINDTHPLYDILADDWVTLRDSYSGEAAIKLKNYRYLPATPGQVLDGALVGGAIGVAAYEAYKLRAVYPDFFELGVRTLVGILNGLEAKFTMPKGMDFLRKRATLKGDSLSALLRKIHVQQLILGRCGLLADMPVNPDQTNPQQYLELYHGEYILNWDDGGFNEGFNKLNLVVLDESGFERINDFTWKEVKKYRILSLGKIGENESLGTYIAGVTDTTDATALPMLVAPSYKGSTLEDIPFVFINATDLVSDPETPPLMGLARLALAIYRGEADYRHTLFMQGQDTLVVIGGVRGQGTDDALRVGAGARVDIDMGGDAKYVGIGANGLPEQRAALEADRSLAAVRTGQLLAPGKMSMESGEALKTRVAAQTATLTTVALSAAVGLESALRHIAVWRGEDPEEVTVLPNLDFTNLGMEGQDLVQLLTAKNLGAPMSYKTIHRNMKERGITRDTFEEEIEAIKEDPKELKDIAEALVAKPEGNNPLNAAGGPKKKPATPATGNKPKK